MIKKLPSSQNFNPFTSSPSISSHTHPHLQVVQVPDHDVTILGAREEHVAHGAEALHEAVVTRQDVDAVPGRKIAQRSAEGSDRFWKTKFFCNSFIFAFAEFWNTWILKSV